MSDEKLIRDLTMMLSDEVLPGYHRETTRRAISALEQRETQARLPEDAVIDFFNCVHANTEALGPVPSEEWLRHQWRNISNAFPPKPEAEQPVERETMVEAFAAWAKLSSKDIEDCSEERLPLGAFIWLLRRLDQERGAK